MASRVRQPHDRPWSARAARAPRWVGLALAATLLLTPGASLAAGGVAGIDEEWSFQFTPYLWALAIDGDMTVGGTTADVSLSFVDIVELIRADHPVEGPPVPGCAPRHGNHRARRC